MQAVPYVVCCSVDIAVSLKTLIGDMDVCVDSNQKSLGLFWH